jgi:hypothetical protein
MVIGFGGINVPLDKFPAESPRRSARTVHRGTAAESFRAVNQRLATAERELHLQFTRIAQLQAQLDLLLGATRRSANGAGR